MTHSLSNPNLQSLPGMSCLPASPASILLLGGRAPACLEWARVLHNLGYCVHVADSVSPFLAQYSNKVSHCHVLPAPAFTFDDWQASLHSIVSMHNIQLIIPTCEEVFYLAKACTTSQALQKRAWTADINILMQLHNKYAFYELINQFNQPICVPKSHLLSAQSGNQVSAQQVLVFLTHLYPELAQYYNDISDMSELVEESVNTSDYYSNRANRTNHTNRSNHALLNTPCDWVLKPCLSRFATHTLIRPTLTETLAALFNQHKQQDCMAFLQQLASDTKTSKTTKTSKKTPCSSAIYSPVSDIPLTNSWLAQTYIQGAEFASYSIAQQGQLVAHNCYQASCRAQAKKQANEHANKQVNEQANQPNHFSHASQQTGASLDFQCVDVPPVAEFVTALVAKLGYTGQLGFDFIKDAAGVYWVLECNPRATSGIHLLACDNQFLAKLHKVASQSSEAKRQFKSSSNSNSNPSKPKHSPNITPFIQTRALHCSLKFAIVYELIKKPKLYRTATHTLKTSHDTIYHSEDLRPMLGQFIASTHLLWQAWRHNKTVLEMSTHDIQWDIE